MRTGGPTAALLEAALGEREARIARLEAGVARREETVASLTQQLQAYRGMSPEAAAALAAEHAAMSSAKHAAEQAAAAVGIKMVALTLVQPAQDLVHGLCVPGADVQLHLQHTHPHKRATGWQANKR